ncbi:MAG: RNA-binding protein [Bacteroidota bacterium]
MKIFVSNLNFKVTVADIRQIFEGYGEVKSAKIIKDRHTGRSKGFGFVEMPDDEQAQQAMHELNGATFYERELKVFEAKPVEEKAQQPAAEQQPIFEEEENQTEDFI